MRKKSFLFLFIAYCATLGMAVGADRSNIGRNNNSTQQSGRAIKTSQPRSKVANNTSRSATNTARSTINRTPVQKTTVTQRSSQSNATTLNRKLVTSRVASTPTTEMGVAKSFGPEYETCRDAYFTCMDQFCATVDETYRRCVCSSRLSEIKKKQSALSTSADSLVGFHDLNLDVINKTADEVRAMTSATIGEQTAANTNDRSKSAQQLSAIGDVLSKKKSSTTASTGGIMDIGGDITSIWSTTDLASGANIATLTGESLYNAVNSQCANLVSSQCPSNSILNMIISAYGMYIENDCAALSTDLGKQKNKANSTIRETGRELHTARLENYDAHNSLAINDCISSVRKDLTANTACGTDFVHCLDITGLYLNIDTGAPIYSKNFFNLENQISLSGNILKNQTNVHLINALNTKKIFAQQSLDKCRDLSVDIWDEFMRQAIIEIRQNQLEKVRQVKTECLGVVNQCYDTQKNQLKDFTNVNEKTLLGLRLETTEDMCRDKLDTCSNLYGGGPDGLAALVNAMHDIVDQEILSECQSALTDLTKSICSTPPTDTKHAYPYACRTYAPGEQQYATNKDCNAATTNIAGCGTDYANSLYQRLVNYAMQVCIRPSKFDEYMSTTVPTLVLQDVNTVMDNVRSEMNRSLSAECESYGGAWVTFPYTNSSIELQNRFYTDTGANKKWGYCRLVTPDNAQTYVIEFKNDTMKDNNGSGHNDYYCAVDDPNSQNPQPYPHFWNNTSCDLHENEATQGNAVSSIVVEYGKPLPALEYYWLPKYYMEFASGTTDPRANTEVPPKCHCQHFCGYYTQPNCGGVQYYNSVGVSTNNWDIAADTTLYACWMYNWLCDPNYYPDNPSAPPQ